MDKYLNPRERAKKIVNILKSLPDDINDIESTDNKSLFSKAIIVNKSLVYLVIGEGNIDKIPFNPKLYFKSSIEYKVRKRTFTTQFGILVHY